VRLERVRVDAFGRLRALDTGPKPLPGLVVVCGPNEAGKSTVFGLLTALLYGFYPASRDRHPHAPWDGAEASGSAVLCLGSGERVEVARRLLASPQATLLRNGSREELRNRSLPWVEHVPREVFVRLFALRLSELAALDDATWSRVQDRLLGALAPTGTRPAREVAAELEEEAGRLWRPTRRGNQRVRELREELGALRRRRREARDADATARETARRLEESRGRLRKAREERQRERTALERMRDLGPVRLGLRRIRELEEAAGPEEELIALPAEPAKELRALESRGAALEERSRELEAEMEAARAVLDALGEEERRVLGRRGEITAFTARASGWAADRRSVVGLRQELRDLDRRLDATAGEILAVPWSEVERRALLAVAVPDLRESLRELRRTREERRARELAEAGSAEARRENRTTVVAASIGLLVAGAALAAVGVLADAPLAHLPALVALGLAAFLLLRGRRSAERAARERRRASEEARAAEAAAREQAAARVAALPLRQAAREEPDESLATGLGRLQELLRGREEREERVRALEEGLAAAGEEARVLAVELGRESGAGPEALARLLEGALRRAERAEDRATAAARELDRLERDASRVARDRAELEGAAAFLRARLEQLGDGDLSRGGGEAMRRLDALERARQLRDELERNHPDLDRVRERIRRAEEAGEEWGEDEDRTARRTAALETLTDEIETLTGMVERLEQEHRRLLEEETVDAVDGAIAALEEEEASLVARRDRLWLLARIVREADRRFREEHQPDILRRAGRWIDGLTGGRYRRLVAEEDPGEQRFHLMGGETGDAVPLAPPLSTGTREQAYLALRLAVMDHLDAGGERLPLLVDEALVNWDPVRRDRGLRLLARVAESRQVFVFTCHPPVAHRLEELGARRLDLDPA
jgi:uncharacterized protein YhaN